MTKAYHSRGLPAFIQDEMGNIGFYFSKKKFPEGVVFIERIGWFLLPNPPPFSVTDFLFSEPEKKRVGRPAKVAPEEVAASMVDKATVPTLSTAEKEDWIKAHGILVQTPILRGFGRQVFFGSTTAAALNNLTAIAVVSEGNNTGVLMQSVLLKVRALAPRMYQKTQLDALATGSRMEGLKQSGKDMTKWIFAAIAGAIIIAAIGLIVYLLTQRPV